MFNDLKAIIFDMDGVIVDTEHLHLEAAKKACRLYDIVVPRSEWYEFVGKPDKEAFTYVIATYTDGSVVSVDTLVALKDRHYSELLAAHIRPVPNAIPFIRAVRENFRLGLATSSIRQDQEHVFELLGLGNFFDAVVTVEDVRNGKPHPEPYLRVVEKLGVPASKCLVIEDAVNGIYSAKEAGCRTVGLTTSFPADVLRNCDADYVVDSFDELSDLLKFRIDTAI